MAIGNATLFVSNLCVSTYKEDCAMKRSEDYHVQHRGLKFNWFIANGFSVQISWALGSNSFIFIRENAILWITIALPDTGA